jgi:hypothetical protein
MYDVAVPSRRAGFIPMAWACQARGKEQRCERTKCRAQLSRSVPERREVAERPCSAQALAVNVCATATTTTSSPWRLPYICSLGCRNVQNLEAGVEEGGRGN